MQANKFSPAIFHPEEALVNYINVGNVLNDPQQLEDTKKHIRTIR